MANHTKAQLLSKLTRCWTIVCYPDSLPDDYLQIISNLHIAAALSPLHSADLNGDGSEKKPHYHLVVKFDGNKSYSQIKEISDKLNAPSPDYVDNERVMCRYLIHRDNPEKAQYSFDDIITFGGYEIDQFFTSVKDDLRMIQNIEHVIRDNKIDNLWTLVQYMINEEMEEELIYLRGHYGWFNALLTGRWQINHKNRFE